MRDVALDSVDDNKAVVEQIGMRNRNASDENLGGRGGVFLGGGDGDAAARAQCLDLGTESKSA